jgi:hypothetical protein
LLKVAVGVDDSTDYVNFSRVVWHESFRKLLESIEGYSFVGCWKECGDKIQRFLFPFIFALSADYEEQQVFYWQNLIYYWLILLLDVLWPLYVV